MITVHNSHLKFEVMHGMRHIYTVDLLPLHSGELQLRGGRFENFVREPQEYKISLRVDGDYDRCHRRMSELLNWVAQHSFEPWSMDFDAEAVGKSTVIFSFKNVTTAVAFKLVWF